LGIVLEIIRFNKIDISLYEQLGEKKINKC